MMAPGVVEVEVAISAEAAPVAASRHQMEEISRAAANRSSFEEDRAVDTEEFTGPDPKSSPVREVAFFR